MTLMLIVFPLPSKVILSAHVRAGPIKDLAWGAVQDQATLGCQWIMSQLRRDTRVQQMPTFHGMDRFL